MAKTRVNKPTLQTLPSIQAAALPLKITKGNPLLNARELDIMLNSDSADVELAWYYYARIPELRYIARYISNALSQARLFIGEIGADPTAPVRVKDSHPAAELMSNFAGGINGQSEILDRLGMHLTLPGDSVLAGPDGFTDVEDPRYNQWRVYSINEMVSRNGVIFAKTIEGREEKLPDGVMPIRVWRPHPKYHWMADSPTRSSFTVLREINLLDQHVHASAVSRLAGAGLLVLPDEITFPADEVETDGEEIDPFIRMLTEVMSIAIRNRESPAAMVPIMLRGSAEAIGAIKHLSFSTPFDEKVPELRQVALRRLALGMDILPEILLGFADSNSWCLDDKTQVYTHRGWVSEPDILIGDECLSLNHETGMSEWQIVTDVYREDVIDESMLSIEGAWHSSLTTMGHRWPVLKQYGGSRNKYWKREWVTSAEIVEKGLACAPNSQIPVKLQRAARLNNLPIEPKYEDALVELVAWMFTEGGLEYRKGADFPKSVTIYQSHKINGSNCNRIRDALTSLYGPVKETILEYDVRNKVGRPFGAILTDIPYWREVQEGERTRFTLNQAAAKPIIEHCPHRMVDNSFVDSLTYSQLKLFIEVAALGDGTTYKTGHSNIGQKNPKMLDALERAAILAGLGTITYKADHNGFGDEPHTQHYVSVTPNRLEYRPRGKNISETSYTGRIWCPTVPPTHSIFIKRNGKTCYTGNSAWQSDESSLRLHIVPLLQLICGALTTGWLKPLLERMPLRPGLAKNIDNLVVWYDISGLRVKPDVVGEVENMYNAFQVSSNYYRHVGGVSESEKPSKEELQTQILLSLLKEPSMAPYAINALTQLGVVDLPEAADPTREILKSTVPEKNVSMDGIREDQAPIGPGLPGQRSADRQTEVTKPSAKTDPNHNSPGAP